MATTGNLYNPDYFNRQKEQQESPATFLANLAFARAEEQKEMDKFSRMVKIYQSAQQQAPGDKYSVDKADAIANDTKAYGVKANDYGGATSIMTIPGVKPNIKFSNGKTSYDFEYSDPNEDSEKIAIDAAKMGIDPTGQDKRTLIKTMAQKNAERYSKEVPEGMEIAGERADGSPILKKIPSESPSEARQRKERLGEVTTKLTTNKSQRERISDVLQRIDKVPAGRFGAMNIDWMKNFDPNNPKLSDWQAVKSILTDTTLLKSMETKGAISDKEMTEFRNAAANDDLISPARIKEALSDYMRKIEAEDEGLVNSYKLSWGSDPREMLNELQGGNRGNASTGPQVGMVEGGYRFKGGNPADPNSWEPVQ